MGEKQLLVDDGIDPRVFLVGDGHGVGKFKKRKFGRFVPRMPIFSAVPYAKGRYDQSNRTREWRQNVINPIPSDGADSVT